ncbi:MAG TPA: Ig-like domain-containing protein [Bacteroidota bacterium]|nr:Ig-like domain-containing protein [Bacteroidota bacterium]
MKSLACLFVAAVLCAGCDSSPSGILDTTTSSNVPPAIVWTDPWPGAVGPNIMSPNNVVIIRFSTLMDTRSVIHNVTISPSDETVYIDTTRATPVEGTTFDFPLTPIPSWLVYLPDNRLDIRFPTSYQIYYPYFKVAQQYTITIGPSAGDIYGDTLGAPISFSFIPEPYFRVTNTYPSDNDTAISPLYPSATMRFNALIDTGSAASAFSISPSVGGNVSVYYGDWGFYWSPPSNVTFASETKYTVTIAPTVKDLSGDQMPSAYSFSFTTAAYGVTSAYPTGAGVSPTASINVYCNFLIDSTSIAGAFSLNPAANGSITYNASSFTFTPLLSLTPNTLYTATVSTALRAKDGTSVKNPYTFSFTTGN